MALQSNADLRLLNELRSVISVLLPLFPVFNFASINISLYTAHNVMVNSEELAVTIEYLTL
jgi:hypothetical protein